MKTAYELAKAEIGVKEIVGDKDNPVVIGYFRDSFNPQIKDDETAWCAAFVGAMLERSGVASTRVLTARSYLNWGVPVSLADAEKGDIVVFSRGNSSWQGHVGFLDRKSDTHIWLLGGNQQNAVNVTKYAIVSKNGSLLGIRRPSPSTNITTVVEEKRSMKEVAILTGIGAAFTGIVTWATTQWDAIIQYLGF